MLYTCISFIYYWCYTTLPTNSTIKYSISHTFWQNEVSTLPMAEPWMWPTQDQVTNQFTSWHINIHHIHS